MMTIEPGSRFGEWVVLDRAPSRGKNARWRCRCSCGNERTILAPSIRAGWSTKCKSCASRGNTNRRKHNESGNIGRRGSDEYRTWVAMKRRCYDANDKRFASYGGRGIRVCLEWLGECGYERFLADMGRRPSPKHSIDRINVNGNYEPDNCRWATALQQQRNRTSNRIIECNGERRTLVEWAEITGLHRDTIVRRLAKGMTVESALSRVRRRLHAGEVGAVLPKRKGRAA